MTKPALAGTFISHSRKDGADFAATLRRDLEAAGFTIWQDLVALEGGRDWWSQIEGTLKSKALQHFILVVTPQALASPVVHREIRLARQEGKSFLPVKGPGLGDLDLLPRWIGQLTDLGIAGHRAS
jgi:TIR domain-containing protein